MGNAPVQSLVDRASQSLLDVLGPLQFSVSAAGEITHANSHALEALGYEGRELLGKPLAEVLRQPIPISMLRQLSRSSFRHMHVLLLGRCTSGSGGELILDGARAVLEAEFPEIAAGVSIRLPDEKSRRVGQSIAAASLPALR